MCLCGGINNTINIYGGNIFSSRFSPCCNMYTMNSCFGFGYGYGGCCPRAFESGLGAGLGLMAGMALIPVLPAVFKGIGKAACWFGNNVLKPVGTFAWNGIKTAGKFVWNGIKAIGKGIGSLFHKKNKTKTQTAE